MDALNMAPGGPPQILCVMNLPPDLNGHGGSQRAEDRIARGWDVIGVCTDEDVLGLAESYRQTQIVKIPNVVNQELIPPRPLDYRFRCLFVGNLSFRLMSMV